MHAWVGRSEEEEEEEAEAEEEEEDSDETTPGWWVATHGGVLNTLSRRVHGRKQF
jgi:hypothetical protein